MSDAVSPDEVSRRSFRPFVVSLLPTRVRVSRLGHFRHGLVHRAGGTRAGERLQEEGRGRLRHHHQAGRPRQGWRGAFCGGGDRRSNHVCDYVAARASPHAAALTCRRCAGRHIGTGEHVEDFEDFEVKSFVSRMLGKGNIAGLVEKNGAPRPVTCPRHIPDTSTGLMEKMRAADVDLEKQAPDTERPSMVPCPCGRFIRLLLCPIGA